MGVGGSGIERDRPSVGRVSLVKRAGLHSQNAQAVVGLGEIGRNFDRSSERRRLEGPLERMQHPTPVVMALCFVRRRRRGAIEHRERVLEPAGVAEHVAEVVKGLGPIWADLERLAVGGLGFVELACVLLRDSEVEERVRVFRLDLDRARVADSASSRRPRAFNTIPRLLKASA